MLRATDGFSAMTATVNGAAPEYATPHGWRTGLYRRGMTPLSSTTAVALRNGTGIRSDVAVFRARRAAERSWSGVEILNRAAWSANTVADRNALPPARDVAVLRGVAARVARGRPAGPALANGSSQQRTQPARRTEGAQP
jgi:hypothetical protein